MIVYFANRKMEILGNAATNLPEGYLIIEDLKTEDVDTGVSSFECKIAFNKVNRLALEEMTNAGNYLLRSNDDENEFYTIIETEIDAKDQTIYIYAEDAGLDLINEIVGPYETTEYQTAAWYIKKFTADSGFEIKINEISEEKKESLSWDNETTVTERIASIAERFGGFEVSYSFDISGMEITHKYINIYEKRGKDLGEQLRLNYDLDRIITKKSVANLATAFLCEGGIPEKSDKPITLKGYSYDDGDFYVDGKYLKSRKAVEKWSRYQWEKNGTTAEGHIVKFYSYDTLHQQILCNHAVSELKKVCDMEVNYEVDVNKLPDNVKIGDRVNIIDDHGQLYLSTRILTLETSVIDQKQTATLGEYKIKTSGISQKVTELAEKFAKNAMVTTKALEYAQTAQTKSDEAQIAADEAKNTAENAQAVVEEAKAAASTAQATATAAQNAADEAKNAVNNVEKNVDELETSIEQAQQAAVQAQQAANTAEIKVAEAQMAAVKAEAEAVEAKETVNIAKEKAEEAIVKADSVYGSVELAKEKAQEAIVTAIAAKKDAQKAEEEIDALGDSITTLERTMTVDYLRKTDLTDVTANLQSQITQNAAEIASTVSKYQMIDETVNDAEEKALQAQEYADAAQEQAAAANAEAEATQAAADEAKNAYLSAQAEADTAQEAADVAQYVADEAQKAVEKAQADLETLQSRADATEAEIQLAQQRVNEAQEALNIAQADANSAISIVTNAQAVAKQAKAVADQAQSEANEAYSYACISQLIAEQALGYAQTAQTNANNTLTQADAARTTAEQAKSVAEQAQATADAATQVADTAQAEADAAAEVAENAQETVTKAQDDLSKAQQTLTTAQARLEEVKANTEATQTEIKAAEDAVANAQVQATAAQEQADAAQEQADAAKQDAIVAQEQADAAKAAAEAAQVAANEASNDAAQAQAIVDGLAVRIENAESLINQNADEIILRATKEEVTQSIGDTEKRIKKAESEIKQLAEQISTLVRGENGESLMVQTENGWTFNMTTILNKIETAAEDVKTLNDGLDSAKGTISTINKSIINLSEYQNYISFEPFKGKPCITLGQKAKDENESGEFKGSDFKVLITNTEIRFMEGSTTPASISNQALNIEKAVVDELLMKNEKVKGEFIWSVRANGNLGLIWKEGEA